MKELASVQGSVTRRDSGHFLGAKAGPLSTTALAIIVAACGGTIRTPGGDPSEESSDGQGQIAGIEGAPGLGANVNSGPNLNLEFPFNGTWFYTGGPHSDGLSGDIRYALDFAPKNVFPCPQSPPLDRNPIVASESGKVVTVGNEKDSTDPNHSIVEVQDDGGFIVGYMHLENIDVSVGQEVKTGDSLGDASCEIPPGGDTSGIHVHEYIKSPDGLPLPIEGTIFSGYEVRELPRNYDGTLVKGDDIKTADTRRCGPGACDGIRNDITNTLDNSTPPGPAIEGPFVPNTPLGYARYRFAEELENYLSRTSGRLNSGEELTSRINLPEDDKERMKQSLAKEGKVNGIIPYYHYIVYQQQIIQEGDVYKVPIQLGIVDIKDAVLTSKKHAGDRRNIGFGMNPGKSVWAGNVEFSGEIRYGVVDLVLKGTAEDLTAVLNEWGNPPSGLINYDSSGFDKITNFSPWETRQVSFDIIAYGDDMFDGALECRSNIQREGFFNLADCLDRDRSEGFGIGIFDLFSIPDSEVEDSGGYNGEFVIEP